MFESYLNVTGKNASQISFNNSYFKVSRDIKNVMKISKFYYKTKCIHWLELFKRGEEKLANYILKLKDNSLGENVIHKSPK